ncbi:MAG TPA: hypothetical protein VKE49_13615, partial [Myxococcaceae bacterium]|nr:hypothetical protein [Myxococcaceae bacterium]
MRRFLGIVAAGAALRSLAFAPGGDLPTTRAKPVPGPSKIAAASASGATVSQLTPAHPKTDGTASVPGSSPGELPPGHPKIDGAASQRRSTAEELPPGRPKTGGTASVPGSSPGELPPGHPRVRDGAAPPTADELIKQLDSTKDLKERQKTFEVAAALGRLYYSHARYKDAVEYLSQALDKAEPTRSLYLEQKKKLHGKEQTAKSGCGADRANLEAETAIARERAKRGDVAGAASCALAALQPAVEAEELRANARFLTGDSPGALSGYERVLQISADSANSLFGRAAVLFDAQGNDPKALRRAKEDFAAFLRLYPGSPRAEEAK